MSVDQIFNALGEPVRRKLLQTLAEESPRTATELAKVYPITRQAILKHLQVLQDVRLVTVEQQGRDKRYSLAPEPLGELTHWVQAISDTWDERLLRLKELLEC